MPDPFVSVVVSTYNRPARLARLLEALRAQTLASHLWEVIVVDNGSGPQTDALLGGEAARGDIALRTARHETTRGPAGGRNTGWRLARGALIAFTDDDCRPEPAWLERALAAARAHPGALLQGPTRPDPAELRFDGVLSHTVRVERLGPYYETSNIFYPRSLLEALGGFDESFGSRPAGEDTDLALRAVESGIRAEWVSDAAVLHAVERIGFLGKLRVAARWGPAVRVVAEHPQARRDLCRGLFWNVWHYLMWRSALALLAPRWLRRFVLARHATELRQRARREHAGAWAVPFYVVHDLVECAAIARGAVRCRTLVL